MRRVHLEETNARQDALHVRGERLPSARFVAAPAEHLEVVDDDEAALLDVGAECGGFGLAQRPPSDFDDVRNRILEQFGIVEREHVHVVGVRAEIADVVHDAHQVLLGNRVAMHPRRTAASPVTARRRLVLNADEREPPIVRHVVDGR